MGGLDILINNAGIQVRGKAEEIELNAWDRLIELNLTATFEMCQLAARQMLIQGQGGKIVNVASMLSFFGGLNCCPYAASKGAVAQLTKALSNEWAGQGINVNAIAPGWIKTNLSAPLVADPERYNSVKARIPQGDWGTPEVFKGVAVLLASDAGSYINGVTIPVDGGYLTK